MSYALRLREILVAFALVLSAALPTAEALPGPGDKLTEFDYLLLGLTLRAEPPTQVVPRNTATGIRIELAFSNLNADAEGLLSLLPSGLEVVAELVGPGVAPQELRGPPGAILPVPPLVERGLRIIGLEPSCLLTFRDEYATLLPNDDRVGKIASAAFMFDEFVSHAAAEGKMVVRFRDEPRQILFHGHCHQKSMIGTAASLAALDLPDSYSVHEIESGCCGMAGSFGFEAEHYDLSMKVGEDRLFPTVRNASDETVICVSGVSCRQQIEHGTGRRPKHLAEVLWEAVKLE